MKIGQAQMRMLPQYPEAKIQASSLEFQLLAPES